MRQIVFDIEANGEEYPRVCQLAYILCGDGMPAPISRNYFFTVDGMNQFAQRVHGWTMRQLRAMSGGEVFGDCADAIRADFYWADIYVGHGVAGDIDYLRREYELLGNTLPVRKRLCTVSLFSGCCGTLENGTPKPPRLEELSAYFSIGEREIAAEAKRLFGGGSRPHDARYDAAATYLALRRAAAENWRMPGSWK